MKHEITALRLKNQQLERPKFKEPGEVVAWFGAVQGQEYPHAKWSLALRLPGAFRDADIERAIAGKHIVRTWALRGTLHLVAADDIRWIVSLVGPRLLAGNARRYGQLELDERTLARSSRVIVRALEGGKTLQRTALLAILRQNGISTEGQRGVYMLQRASLDGLVCQGVAERNNATFMLIDEALPKTKPLSRDQARGELARRYFQSHGPATLQDFVWWSGLATADARAGLEAVRSEFESETAKGKTYWFTNPGPNARVSSESKVAGSPVYLLPTYDEYWIGYRDRDTALDPEWQKALAERFSPTIVSRGKVIGLWSRTIKNGKLVLARNPFAAFSAAQERALAAAARRYGEFLGMPVVVA